MHSICMATYNGGGYVERQIKSITKQIGEDDELIVVDDCSNDDTVEIIKKINDERIKLFINDENVGVNKTFEKAILLAHGDIVFLSDQDDIWSDNKYKVVIDFFRNNPTVDLIQHDAAVLNEKMEIIDESLFHWRGNMSTSLVKNFFRGTYVGCCMAAKREVLIDCIPFTQIPYHDKWIGIIAGLKSYNMKFVNDKLIDYIRHESSTSPFLKHRRGIVIILKERIKLFLEIINFMFKSLYKNIRRES